MKNALRATLVIATGLITLAAGPLTATAQDDTRGRLIDGIAAVVNDSVILISEFEEELEQARERLSQQDVQAPPDDVLREQVLESLITRELQLQEAEQRGIQIDDISLNNTIRDIASRNADSLAAFRRQLEADGIPYEAFREDIRRQMLLNEVRQQIVSSRVVITEQEVDDHVASQSGADDSQYRLSHIQIAVEENADREARSQAESKARSIYQRLIDGEAFSKLAVAESDGRNALDGGSLGWRQPGELPREFASEVRNLTVGEVSKPFRTSRGYHILKLHDTKGVERHFVKQVNARHILIATDELIDDEAARLKLADLRQQILDGADFADLAREHSEDPGSASQGGELGWTDPREYVPGFREVIEDLPTGKLSEPFQTTHGWHIVEVLGWREHENTVQEQRYQARQTLYERKARMEEELWLSQLRDEAYVDIRIDL